MVDIKVKDLKIAQKKAGKKALNSNKRAGLKTYVVKNDNVIEIDPDGKEKVIKKAEFKTVRIFAGPNGSGKSSIIEQIKDQVKFGYYINADDIQIQLNQKRFINCIAFLPFTIVQNDWIEFL